MRATSALEKSDHGFRWQFANFCDHNTITGKMNILLRLLLLVCLVFAGQSYATTTALAYSYEANAVQLGVENLNNNGLINPSDCCSKLSVRDAQDRAQAGSFFAFAADLDVPKGKLTTSSNEKITWVDENASMSSRARSYDDGATGSRSNVETKLGQAPILTRTTADGKTATVRFDGVDGDVLIDRKISVVTTQKAKNQVLRQSEALQQNGLTARWEVTTQSQANRATKMFEDLGVKNITVTVVPE